MNRRWKLMVGKLFKEFREYLKYKAAKEAEANGDKEYFINSYSDKKWWKELLSETWTGGSVKARLPDGTTLWIIPPDSGYKNKVNWEL